MTGLLASGSSTSSVNPTAVLISVGIPFVVCLSIAVIVWAYFRLQAHRADAIANAEYRKLAEEAVANQQELRDELARLTLKVEAVEKLMREVG
jgi:hypothetical protein